MREKVNFYQTRPFFFTYEDCDVIKTKNENYTEYSCNEKQILFEVELLLKENYIEIHITDIVITLPDSGIGKSVFAYLLSEAIYVCNNNHKNLMDIPFEKCTLFGISVHPYPVE